MLLDPPTLLFTTALVIAFSGLLLLAAHRPGAESPVLEVWGVAMLFGAAGLAMAGGAAKWPVPYGPVADFAGTVSILLGTAICWTAARLFHERRPFPALIVLGPALWVVTQPFHSDSAQWVALSSMIGVAYTLATAFELWQTRPERLPSRPAAMGLLLFHALIFGGHALAALFDPRPTSAGIMGALILESLLHTNGIAFLLLAMVKERTELRSNDKLRALTRLDGLTGIANRRHFDEQLRNEIRRSARREPTLALLLIDIDHFKAYNDAAGHQQGDTCLREVAQTIARHVRRPGDLATRYGGEEFAVVMANTNPDGALALAERMREAVEAMAIVHPGIQGPGRLGLVTISIGVALLMPTAGQTTAEDLVRLADTALYEAKAAGRNMVRAAWMTAGDKVADQR